MKYYFEELNWINQIVHPPSVLEHYERWWNTNRLSQVADVEFAVLMLRICIYATYFLPSQRYTVDSIRGKSLSENRSSCNGISAQLENIFDAAMLRGLLIRVQYMYITGMCHECEGRIKLSWSTLCCAIREAQEVGLHRESLNWGTRVVDDVERAMSRRVFCNLYIWDRFVLKGYHLLQLY
jgi:hypothetical protein